MALVAAGVQRSLRWLALSMLLVACDSEGPGTPSAR